MSDDNKHNLLYFESNSMKELFDVMEEWQRTNNKRLLSTNIQKDRGKFCCIALSNPTEVSIVGAGGGYTARVSKYGYLQVVIHGGDSDNNEAEVNHGLLKVRDSEPTQQNW